MHDARTVDADRHQAPGACPLGRLGQLVVGMARDPGHAGRGKPEDPAAGRQRVVEDAEPGAGRGVAEIVQFEPEPQIRLVGSEPVDRLAVGEAPERQVLDRPVWHDGAADLDRHLLDPAHDVVLGHEAHLQVELGELRLAVAAQVLVAEAARDLEVAIHAGDHEQLLQLLRALRQRIDLAGLQPRRNDEVARALRCGLDEQRGLDLDEAGGVVRSSGWR